MIKNNTDIGKREKLEKLERVKSGNESRLIYQIVYCIDKTSDQLCNSISNCYFAVWSCLSLLDVLEIDYSVKKNRDRFKHLLKKVEKRLGYVENLDKHIVSYSRKKDDRYDDGYTDYFLSGLVCLLILEEMQRNTFFLSCKEYKEDEVKIEKEKRLQKNIEYLINNYFYQFEDWGVNEQILLTAYEIEELKNQKGILCLDFDDLILGEYGILNSNSRIPIRKNKVEKVENLLFEGEYGKVNLIQEDEQKNKKVVSKLLVSLEGLQGFCFGTQAIASENKKVVRKKILRVKEEYEKCKLEKIKQQVGDELKQDNSVRKEVIEQLKQDDSIKNEVIEQLKQDNSVKNEVIENLKQDDSVKNEVIEQLKQDEETKKEVIEQLKQDEQIKSEAVSWVKKNNMEDTELISFTDFNQKQYLAYLFLGMIHDEQGNVNSALANFNQAINLNPEEDITYFLRGKIYYQQGDLKSALADFNQAISLNPDQDLAYIFRAEIHTN